MFGAHGTRTLLGPVDPARNTAVAPPRLSARDLIARAEAATEPIVGRRHARPTRRLVLAAGAVAVATGAAAVIHPFGESTADRPKIASPPSPKIETPPRAEPRPVLVPIAYQFDTDAPAARDQLRALAGKLVDAPYDNRTGRYTYHHTKLWGDPVMSTGDGRYILGYTSERKVWQAADGTGRQLTTELPPEYPDQESRDYWERNMPSAKGGPETKPVPLPPFDIAPLPSDRAGLRELLKVRFGAGAVNKGVATVYGRYAVPRQTRAEILRILAEVPGLRWRGEVTDRAGRKGVAITFDDRDHGQQSLLIFDRRTGALLAHELLVPSHKRIRTYQLILGTDRTNRLG